MNREISFTSPTQDNPFNFEEGLRDRRPSFFNTPNCDQNIFVDENNSYYHNYAEISPRHMRTLATNNHSNNKQTTSDHNQFMNQSFSYLIHDHLESYQDQHNVQTFNLHNDEEQSRIERPFNYEPILQADYFVGTTNREYQLNERIDHNIQQINEHPFVQTTQREEPNESTDYSTLKVENNSSTRSKHASSSPSSQNDTVEDEPQDIDEISSQSSSLYINRREQKCKRKTAKKDKLYTEQDLEDEIELVVNQDQKVVEMQNELQQLKKRNLNKKDLQIQRNRITAQLSRDRKKIEMDFLRAELIQLKQKLRELQNNINEGDICQKCSIGLIQQFNLQKRKTRVHTSDFTEQSQSEKRIPTQESQQKSTDQQTSRNYGQPQRTRGALQFGGSSKTKMIASVGMFAIVALACIVGYQQPLINSDQTLQTYELPLQSKNQLRNLQISDDTDMNYEHPVVPYSPPLINSYASQMKHNKSTLTDSSVNSISTTNYPLITIEDYQEEQLEKLLTFEDLRQNYINRQAVKMIRENKLTTQHYTNSDEYYNDKSIFKALKSPIPAYYTQVYPNTLLQLDDGDDNDLVQYVQQPVQQQNKKFLNKQSNPPQPIAKYQDIYSLIDKHTTSVMCPASQVLLPNTGDVSNSPITQNNLILIQNRYIQQGNTSDKLHLLLSPNELDILNPQNNALLELQGDKKPLFIELSCKILEINYIYEDFTQEL